MSERAATPARRGRAVVLVGNPAAPYSRGLRVARSLAGAGWEVELAAVAAPGLPVEERDGEVRLRRYRPSGPWRRFAAPEPGEGAPEAPAVGAAGAPGASAAAGPRDGPASAPGRRLASVLGRLGRAPATLVKLIAWPYRPRAWWWTLRRELAPADLYHACGILALPGALALAADARRRGRRGIVVYDAIDAVLDSINVARVPPPIRRWYRRREARWVARAAGVVTVNDALADRFVTAWRLPERPVVLPNCPPRWDPPSPPLDLIRAATGISPDRPIVVFLGRLGPARGLDEAAEAVLRLPDAAFVAIGFGVWAERLAGRDRDPRFAGRHYTLPAVHPDDVPAWTASADVSFVALPPVSTNQMLSTPNKLWESLAAGTPVVVGRDLPVMRELVERERLGAVADAADPDDIARALRSILGLPAAEYAELRSRCLALAHDRWNWDAVVGSYLALVDRLAPGHSTGPDGTGRRPPTSGRVSP